MKDDTISRSAAIDAVEHITSSMSICLNEDECHGMKRMQRQAVLELANIPSAQPGWIPWDSGKLPKESGYYTVTAYDGATKRVTYAKYQKRLKRWELTGARAYWRVLAWLPPLEPWEGETG